MPLSQWARPLHGFRAAAAQVAAALGLCLLTTACSDAGLQPAERPGSALLDNLLRLSGNICVDDPEKTSYPVKILFVIDASGSMQFTDPNKQVQVAVKQVIDRLKANPSVQFGIISFNGIVRVNSAEPTPQGNNNYDHVTPTNLGRNAGFFPGTSLPQAALDGITIRDIVTDYQGALGAAYRLLELDMLAASPADRTRSKYVVLFLSDGWPNPQCNSDCMNANAQPVCVDRSTLPKEATDAFPELKACKDYNLPYQIYSKVDQIMRLRSSYSVGDLRFHTIWLRDPNDKVTPGLGFNAADAKELLSKMALEHGNGTFSDFYSGDQVTFAKVDYSSILRPYGLAQLLVHNRNARPGVTDYQIDSDGDGLSDDEESRLGTDPKLADTDGDGYSDGFEQQRVDRAFDPRDPQKPWFTCTDRVDLDGDGLSNCEEAVLGTDARLTDTDGDRVPDGLEQRYRTDPLLADDAVDSDSDGVVNLQEFQAQSDPLAADARLFRDARTSYAISDRGEALGQNRCYDFEVSKIPLMATLGQKGPASRGVNRVMMYFDQSPRDSGSNDPGKWRVACVDAVWVPPAFKLPVTGQLTLTSGNLYDASRFDPKLHCVQVNTATKVP